MADSEQVSNRLGRSWRRLLIEVELAQHYHVASSLTGLGSSPRSPILESILPSLLHVKAVAILDHALRASINSRGLSVPKKYRDSLKGRIDFLVDQGVVKGGDVLHRIRDLRNDIAHEVDDRITWKDLERDTDDIHAALHGLGLVADRPKFEFYAERNPVELPDDPEALFAFRYEFGVKEGAKVAAKVEWTERILHDGE